MRPLLLIIFLSILSAIAPPVMALEDARNFDTVLENLIFEGDQLTELYSPQQSLAASDGFSRLYFDQFESSGLEFRLAAQEPKLTARIELDFTRLIQSTLRAHPKAEIATQWAELSVNLQKINTSDLNSESWISSFVQSMLILLREGVEAILLLSLLVTILNRSGHGDRIPLIGYGAGTALLASVALAYGLQSLISNIAQTREMIEGLVLLAAALLLCYVGLWLLSQKESQRWQQFLHERIEHELQRSNQFAVFFMAFIAVFREGAETILFYQALMIDTQSFDQALWAGAVTAAALLIGVYFGLNRIIRFIRLDYFFKTTAILLLIMALIFTGKGVMELQASGFLDVTTLNRMPLIPVLGIFPTAEALISQLVIITGIISIFFRARHSSKQLNKHR